jgi:hypothetical protein
MQTVIERIEAVEKRVEKLESDFRRIKLGVK